MNAYNPEHLEKKWQKKWEEQGLHKAPEKVQKKCYILPQLPYPSGSGLHVGHAEVYTACDMYARYQRMIGKDVLQVIGWDAFGLPAENYAIKTNVHPRKSTNDAIDNFRSQIKALGISVDWEREVGSHNPDYYKWTQWFFLLMYTRGLAYRKKQAVNWCDSCKTVLANEQVVDGACERCDTTIVQKDMEQWYLKITEYADRLIEDLDKVDWPEETIRRQRNWIGRSQGAEVQFVVAGSDEKITVFTTRPDTLFGATYMVLAPEHDLVETLKDNIENWEEVSAYVEATAKKSDLDRQIDQEKTGVELKGIKAINPVNQEEIPVWIADYVLSSYGTGAIMAVPAHDERDFAFAQQFGLEMRQVVALSDASEMLSSDLFEEGWEEYAEELGIRVEKRNEACIFTINLTSGEIDKFGKLLQKFYKKETDVVFCSYSFSKKGSLPLSECRLPLKIGAGQSFPVNTEPGIVINSAFLDDLKTEEAKFKIIAWLEEKGIGRAKTQYKLRDWSVSRQRFWGAPIPMLRNAETGELKPIPEEDLPVILPDDVDFKPTGESPLNYSPSFQDGVEEKYGKGWKREVDTLDTFMCSSWYFFRYLDPNNDEAFASEEQLKKWMPIDFYLGGEEHVNGHLLYSRFFTKVLYDAGYITFDEPFTVNRHQGLILGEDGRKMSKRWGNVINPTDVVNEYGADTLRMYEMFMGPLEQTKSWSTGGVKGVRKFLDRVWRLQEKVSAEVKSPELESLTHKTLKKVTEDTGSLQFNTAIAKMMELSNAMTKADVVPQRLFELFVLMLAPYAPHMAEELWEAMGHQDTVTRQSWPAYDESKIVEETITLVVQINGKVRAKLEASADITEEEAKQKALQEENVQKWLEGKEPKKIMYIAGKLVSIVV